MSSTTIALRLRFPGDHLLFSSSLKDCPLAPNSPGAALNSLEECPFFPNPSGRLPSFTQLSEDCLHFPNLPGGLPPFLELTLVCFLFSNFCSPTHLGLSALTFPGLPFVLQGTRKLPPLLQLTWRLIPFILGLLFLLHSSSLVTSGFYPVSGVMCSTFHSGT